MANKPIITIPIDDKQFNNFVERFENLEKKINALPDSWKKVGDSAIETNEAFSAGLGALIEHMAEASDHTKALVEHLKNASEAQGQFNTSAREGETGLKKMVREAKELGDNIFGIGKFLLKIGAMGIGSIAGGLFGIDKLGESAVANQRSARMMGLTTGQYRAFDTDLGRDVGDSTLQHVIDAQHDLTKQFYLAHATGLSREQVSSMDAGSLAAMLAMAENAYIKAHPGWNMQSIQAAGFTQLGEGQSDLLLHGNTPLSEQQRALTQYQRDSGNLNYSSGTVDALYDFTNRLHIAGQRIETDFSDKLSDLNKNGSLSKFITNLEKDAEILINGVLSEKNLTSIENGLSTLANYLGSGEFSEDVKKISDDVKKLADGIGWASDEINKIIHPDPDSIEGKIHSGLSFMHDLSAKVMGGIGKVLGKDADEISGAISDSSEWAGQKINDIRSGKSHFASPDSPVAGFLGWWGNSDKRNNPGNLRSAPGYPTVDGFAAFPSVNEGYAAMAWTLAGYPTKHHDDTLAKIIADYAPAKDHNNTAAYIANVSKWTGWDPNALLNLNDSQILVKLMSAMLRQEGTRVAPETIEADIAKAHWTNPAGTSDDIKKLIATIQKQGTKASVVTINNPAGANVAVSTNAAAP